jgi:hypothetical protein
MNSIRKALILPIQKKSNEKEMRRKTNKSLKRRSRHDTWTKFNNLKHENGLSHWLQWSDEGRHRLVE